MKRDPDRILEDLNVKLGNEMQELFEEISNVVSKADPLNLVEDLSIGLIMFNDFNNNSNSFITLSQLEFIIGLMLSKDSCYSNQEKKCLNSEQIADLASNVGKFFTNWTFTYHLKSHKTESRDENSERDRLISSLVTHHSIVRGDTFVDQEAAQLVALFSPYQKWMRENLGFSVENAVRYIEKITEHYSNKFEQFFNDNDYKNYDISKSKQVFSHIRGTMRFRVDDILGTGGIYSNEFNSFIKCFSVEYGQTFNESLRYPSDQNIFRSKPIIKFNEYLIVPSPSSLMWAIQSGIEERMKSDSKQWEKYQKHKGRYLESEVALAFKKIFPKSSTYQSLFYEVVVDGQLKKFELDCLIIYDTNIILAESKSGIYSDNARKGGVKRLERIIKDNIESAFVQAQRARNYINNSDLPIFYDENGVELLRIEKANFYRIYLINTTLHNFGEIATMLQSFGRAGLYGYDEYPVSLNINDLKIMAENIMYSSQFLHYLHRRVNLNNRLKDKATIVTSDELDLFAQYFETNLYYEDSQEYDMIYIPDYAPEYNQRYLMKKMGMPVKPLEQKLNPQFRNIILDLENLGEFGFTNIILNLLDLSGEARDNLMKYLGIISKKTRDDGKFHDFTMHMFNNPNDPKSGLGITLTTGLLKDREAMAKQLLTHCQLKKNQLRCYEWIGIGRYIDSPRWFVDEAIYLRFEEEYDEQLEQFASEYLRGKQINFRKFHRNAPCPCGSGVKYKKCHGK
jgi:hypothetical protein